MARNSSAKSLLLRCAALAACFILALHSVHAEPETATAEKPAAAPDAAPTPPPPAAAPPPPPPPLASKPKTSAPKPDKPMKKAASGSSSSSMVSKLKHDVDHFLHSTEAHTAKSALVLSDVALVMAGIQLQLSIVHENYLALKAGGEAVVAKKHSHMAHVHHEREHLCAQGSIGILSILLLENLAAMWAQGPKKFFKKTAQGVDLFIVSTSLYLEIIFERLTGAERVIAEWWRFVRIVHGAYETFFHSPIVAPLFNPSFGHGHH